LLLFVLDFNAPEYDMDGFHELEYSSQYIPWNTKIRNMLDIGAGGGSLGILLKRKYDIQTIASAFPDWPYCEYITERGELCVYIDVMEAMPFASNSFDVLHTSWVYHGQQPNELLEMYLELNRILRPGGYLWMRGGWSNVQVDALRHLFKQLGYTLLNEHVSMKPEVLSKRVSFGDNLPYHLDWTAIFVKPIKAIRNKDCKAPEPRYTI
jgi:SAM-dependent methyltransferase